MLKKNKNNGLGHDCFEYPLHKIEDLDVLSLSHMQTHCVASEADNFLKPCGKGEVAHDEQFLL